MKLHSSAKHKPCLKQQQAFHRMKGRNRKQVLPLDQQTPRWRTPSQKNHPPRPPEKKKTKRNSHTGLHRMATRIWRMCTCDGTRNGIQFVEIDADLLRPNRLPPTQRGEQRARRNGSLAKREGRGGGERSGRREKDITRRNRPLIATIIKRNVMCILHF